MSLPRRTRDRDGGTYIREMTENKLATAAILTGALIALAGFVTSVVYFLQPWRSCDYEDTSAGCAMLPGDAAVMTLAMLATVVGIGVLLGGLGLRAVMRRVRSAE